MVKRDPAALMWAEACNMIEEAERLHRQFFRLGASGARMSWEPPVDVLEDDEALHILVALPGVPADHIDVVIEGDSLLVRAQCEMPFRTADTVIQRMEIPHGHFERRIRLPGMALQLEPPRTSDGVLILNLRKRTRRV